jgi:hypothetical protein
MADPDDLRLAAKLGVKEGARLVLLNAPAGFELALPAGVTLRTRLGGRADVALAFFTVRSRLQARATALGAMAYPAGGTWVAWPKRSSGVPTDPTDDEVRTVLLPLGLVDNKVCAIDGTWSALRFVWRTERRTAALSPSP